MRISVKVINDSRNSYTIQKLGNLSAGLKRLTRIKELLIGGQLSIFGQFTRLGRRIYRFGDLNNQDGIFREITKFGCKD